MRQQGRLTEWNDDRGFGFITPLAGGSRIFVHISEFPHDQRRPVVNDQVTYTVGRDRQGRPCAQAVLPLTPLRPAVAHSQKASRSFGVSALFLAIAVIAVVYVGREQVDDTRTVVEPSAPSNEAVASAFQEQRSGVQVTGEGIVTKVLPDDNDGSRHQRFIVRLASGPTLPDRPQHRPRPEARIVGARRFGRVQR